jgi:hypothetical protein
MRKRIGSFVAVLATALLMGCVGPVPKIDPAPEKLAAIKSIAVIRVPEPKTYTVWNIGHPGMAFGLIGGLIAAADQSNKQDTLSKAYKLQGTAVNQGLVHKVSALLKEEGYEVVEQDGPWVEKDNAFTLAFDKVETNADAILVVSPAIVGFVSPAHEGNYLPTITSVATLHGQDRTKPLYRGYHAAGWTPAQEGWHQTEARTKYPDFSALMKDTAGSASALEMSADDIARSVTKDLRRAVTTGALN